MCQAQFHSLLLRAYHRPTILTFLRPVLVHFSLYSVIIAFCMTTIFKYLWTNTYQMHETYSETAFTLDLNN